MLKPVTGLPLATRRFLADRSGATAIEYGLIIALVGLAMLAGLGNTRDGVAAMFNNLMIKVAAVVDGP